MKSLISTIIILILILLSSYITVSYISTETIETPITLTNQETNIQTYEVLQEPSGRDMLIQTIKETEPARQRNLRYIQREEEIAKCIKKITKNWKRTYSKRSTEKEWGKLDPLNSDKKEWLLTDEFYEKKGEFYGYNSDEDWDLRWKLKNRALDGEEIC